MPSRRNGGPQPLPWSMPSTGLTSTRGLHSPGSSSELFGQGNLGSWKVSMVQELAWALGGHVSAGKGLARRQREGRAPSVPRARAQDSLRAALQGRSQVGEDPGLSSGQAVLEGRGR